MLARFVEYLTYAKRAKPTTLRNYKEAINAFEKFRNGVQINHSLISGFQIALAKKNLKPVTVNGYLTALRMYFQWQELNGFPCYNYRQIHLAKLVPPKVDYLNKSELKRFFGVIDAKGIIGLRNRAMLLLIYVTGLRVGELVALDRESIDFRSKEIPITGKGGVSRTVFLTDESTELLQKYLETRDDDFPALFISYRNFSESRRLTTVMVESIVRTYARKAGITKHVTPHCLRRSFATNLHLNGCPITGVQSMLGHSSVMTTQVYIRFANPEIKTLHGKFLTPI